MACPYLQFWGQFPTITDPYLFSTQDPHHLRPRSPISLCFLIVLLCSFSKTGQIHVCVRPLRCSPHFLRLLSVIPLFIIPFLGQNSERRKLGHTSFLLFLFSFLPFPGLENGRLPFYFLFISTSEITCGKDTSFILLLICQSPIPL